MNLIIDGVDKGEAISLIEEVKEGFDPEKVQVVSEPRSNKVGSAGFYSRHVVRGLDLPHVYFWEGSWISRIVEQKMVGATPSEFEYEFLNHRLNLNRGDHFVLLPDTRLHYYSLFPQEELEDGYVPQHILEKRYDLFQDYATKWGYETLHTDFSDEAFQQNVLISRRAAVYNQHPFHSTDYVGPENPLQPLLVIQIKDLGSNTDRFIALTCPDILNHSGEQRFLNSVIVRFKGFKTFTVQNGKKPF
jgi:hypothetical protein